MLRHYQHTILFFLVLGLALWVGVRQAKLNNLPAQSPESEQVTLFFSQAEKYK